MVKEKGVRELLDAFGTLAQEGAMLTLIGPSLGSERNGAGDWLDKAASRLPIGSLRRLGKLNPQEIRQELLAADAFVLPSYREGVPRSVIEAMACGLPCVVTNVRGCRELVQDGVNGYVVPPEDSESLRNAMAKLAKARPDALKAMAAAAFEIAEASHRERVVLRRLRDCYEELGIGFDATDRRK